MTPQEYNELREIADKLDRVDERTDRIETALIGSPAFGVVGLVGEVHDLKLRQTALEGEIRSMRAIVGVVNAVVSRLPGVAVAAVAFYLGLGGDPLAVWEFVARLLR